MALNSPSIVHHADHQPDIVPIRLDNAVSSTTSAPTAATAGIPTSAFLIDLHQQATPTPATARQTRRRLHLIIQKSSASGTRLVSVKLFGYTPKKYTYDESQNTLTEIASSGSWSELDDTGDLSESADFEKSVLIIASMDYTRLATQITANSGGGSESVSTYIALGAMLDV